MERPDIHRLGDVLADVALLVLTDRSLKADLERLIRVACKVIPNCSAASVAMLVDGEPTTVAVNDRVAMELDLVQYDHGEGPCIACLGGQAIRVAYLPSDERFPHFAVGAADRRVLSVLSTPARGDGVVIGSLNIYSRLIDAFDDEDEAVALVFAAQVANAIARSTILRNARTTRELLQQQYDEAAVVSMAQGVVMAVQECSAAQAATLIRSAAHTNEEQLITTAERILHAVQHADMTLAADDEPREDRDERDPIDP